MDFTGFIGSSYVSQSPNADCEDLINLYVQTMESPGAKAPQVLYPAPGFVAFTTLPQSPIREMLTQNNRTFVVAGVGAYEIDAAGVVTFLGTMAQDSNPATISTNGPGGNQVFFTSGNHGYIYNLVTGVFTANVLTGVTFGGFIDGYFVALDAVTSTIKISALEDGTAWDPLDVAQRSTSGDKWVSMLVCRREIWLFGSQLTDVWTDSGDADFPFTPIAFVQHGIMAPFARVAVDSVPHWWSADENGVGVFYRARQYDAERVSTFSVERSVQSFSTIADAVCWGYQEDGHTFALTNFTTGGVTWAFDVATNQWHKRGRWDSAGMTYTAGRPQSHAYAFTKHLVGDRVTGAIYQQTINRCTEADGTAIRRVRRAPLLASEQRWNFFDAFQLDLEVGLGLLSGQGSDPMVMLRWSNNQAKTWSNEHWVTAGALGTYGTRAIWRVLGSARNRVFEVAMTDPIPWRLTAALVTVRPGIN